MKKIFLFASIMVASGLLMTNIYTSIVDAASWGSDIPNSIGSAREYFKTVNPGHYFRIFSPINQIVALLVLILFWRSSPSIRLYSGIALMIYVLCDVLTFAYFYPRNDIMFVNGSLTDAETLQRVWSEWNTMNWVRSLLGLTGIIFSFITLHKVYTIKEEV